MIRKRNCFCVYTLVGILICGLFLAGCARDTKGIANNINVVAPALQKPERPADHAKVALVLGGGGARGLSHIGVLKVLEREKIPVDIIVGTSIGAIIGVMYASHMSAADIEAFFRSVLQKPFRLIDLEIFGQETYGLLKNDPFRRILEEQVKYQNIESLPIPFAAVATDLDTGEEIVFQQGPIFTAVSASAAVPGIFKPVAYNNHWLVDGGLVNNLPINIARRMGADIVIAVKVNHPLEHVDLKSKLDVLLGSLHVVMNNTTKANEHLADILIAPPGEGINSMDFRIRNLELLINTGEAAAREKTAAINAKLQELRNTGN